MPEKNTRLVTRKVQFGYNYDNDAFTLDRKEDGSLGLKQSSGEYEHFVIEGKKAGEDSSEISSGAMRVNDTLSVKRPEGYQEVGTIDDIESLAKQLLNAIERFKSEHNNYEP